MLNVLMFFSVYCAGFYASLFRNPVYAFVLYEVVYFFYPRGRWWGGMVPDISYSFFVVVLMFGLLVLNYNQLKQNRLFQSPPLRWMYVLVLLFVLVNYWAVFPELHKNATIDYVKLIIIMSIAYKLCDSKASLDYMIYGYLVGVWYIGYLGHHLGRNSGDRLEGVGTVDGPDANDIAAAIAPAVVLCLYYFWTSDKWWMKGVAVICGVFVANCLVLINSRGAFLGAIVSIGFFMVHMFFSRTQRKYQKAMAIFITVAGLGGVATLIDESALDRFSSISSDLEVSVEQESGATRMIFWEAAWELAKDHPLGTGYLGFNHFAPEYIPEEVNTGAHRNRTVHSSWFEALSEVGYLGFIAFIMMVYSAYRVLDLCKKRLRGEGCADDYFKMIAIQAALIAFVVAMTFINRMRAEVLYWLILYAACAYNVYVLKANSEATHKASPSVVKGRNHVISK